MMDFWKICISILWIGVLETSAFTPLKNCGTSKVVGSADRIVGGRETAPGEFPWQVSLQFKLFLRRPVHMCGATILNEWWILTAAHCVNERAKGNLRIVTGMYGMDDKSVNTYSVNKVIMHKDFDPKTFLNDIALIQVKKRITFSDKVNSICLPTPGQNATGITTASGWGDTAEDGESPSVLMAVELPIVPQDVCDNIFGPDFYSKSAMLCAGYPQGGKDTCQGDSGGPLVQRQNGLFVQVGIVSFGVGCARPQLPGVYTKVSNYISWINENTD